MVVWLIITNSRVQRETRDFAEVPLGAENIPSEYLVTKSSPETVRVKVTGKARDVEDRLSKDDIYATVDLTGAADEGGGRDEITVTRTVKSGATRNRSVATQASTEFVEVTIERIKRADVPVQVKPAGTTPVGYEAEIAAPEPQLARIEGSRRNILSVAYVSAEVKLDGLITSLSQTVILEPKDKEGRTIGNVVVQPERAAVKVSVIQRQFQRQVVVDLRWRGQPRTGFRVVGMRSEPQVVTVVGPLDQITSLPAIATDVVDIEGADRDVRRPVRLQLVGGVSISDKEKEVMAVIAIQSERGAGSLPGVVPRVTNVGVGLEARLITPVLAINVSGPLSDVSQLRLTAVSVTVDAAGLGPGSYKLDPRVLGLPPSIDLNSVVPERVEITIAAPAR